MNGEFQAPDVLAAAGEEVANPHGHIRSFVLRQGRVSNAQQQIGRAHV